MSNTTALVIIDMQVGLLNPVYHREEVLANIQTLLTKARTTNIPVVYVQHDGPVGHGLEVNTPDWQIHPAIAPREGEQVVHKHASDSFHNTALKEVLDSQGIQHLVVVGGQTEYCVDTTVRRATTCQYDVTLVGDAHTTLDTGNWRAEDIIAYHNDLLDGFRTDNYSILVRPTSMITL